jgi:hypothetical protein
VGALEVKGNKMSFVCQECGENFISSQDLGIHCVKFHCVPSPVEAQREPIPVRYDLLIPEFIREMSRLVAIGAEVYGDRNWQRSRLQGEKGPVNHIYEHMHDYLTMQPHDRLNPHSSSHLVSVAVNAMFEWWYERVLPRGQNDPSQTNSK